MIRLLQSTAQRDDKRAPYDWAKVRRKGKLKAAAIKCLFWGVLTATAETIVSWLFDKNAAIRAAAKAGAVGCATNVAGGYFKNKLKENYKLEVSTRVHRYSVQV